GRSRGCTGCHDAGDGTPAGRIEPLPGTRAFPSNLTGDLETGLGAWTDEQVARAIREGLDASGSPLCEVMPRYDELDTDELRGLVAWIRSLEPVHREIPESRCYGGPGDFDGGGPAPVDGPPAPPFGDARIELDAAASVLVDLAIGGDFAPPPGDAAPP